MRKFFNRFFSLFKDNLGMKITSLVFAILLWSYVVSETNPFYNKTIRNVPVTILNYEMLDDKDIAIVGGLSSVPQKIDVTIEVQRSDYTSATLDSVSAVADFSTVSDTGEQTVRLTISTKYGEVVSSSTSELKLTIDEQVTRIIPVTYVLTGEKSDNYYYGMPVLSDATVEITGAKSEIENATKAVCEVDLTGVTQSIENSTAVKVLDDNNKEVDLSHLKNSLPSVIIKMEVLPKKTVTINGLASVKNKGTLAAGYEIKDVTVEPLTIEIAGEQSVLDNITEVYLETIYVNKARDSFTVTGQIKEISGVKILKSREVLVTVVIGKS